MHKSPEKLDIVNLSILMDRQEYRNFESLDIQLPEILVNVEYFPYGTDPFLMDCCEIIQDFLNKKAQE